MSEVEITCLGDTALIHDIGLRMTRGSRVMTTLTAISKSMDLEDMKRRGLVSVRVLKAQTIRRENFPMTSPNDKRVARAAHPVAPPPTEAPDTSLVLRELLHEIRGLREDIKKSQSTSAGPTTQAIAEAVHSALSRVSLNPVQPAGLTLKPILPPEERFIPSGIVSKTAKADISTTNSVAPATSGLDDASEALRKARRKEG